MVPGGRLSAADPGQLPAVADPVFLRILWRSLRLALLTTALCLLSGYALAYWIAFYGGRRKQLYSFWSFYLSGPVIWCACMPGSHLLADHGIINNVLMTLGVLQHPLPLLHNEGAVLLGLVYTYLPFMVLPLYASLERLDRCRAGSGGGPWATPAECFSKVTLPLTKGGMLSGSVLVFVPSVGEF